jgi:hypothetical protein
LGGDPVLDEVLALADAGNVTGLGKASDVQHGAVHYSGAG